MIVEFAAALAMVWPPVLSGRAYTPQQGRCQGQTRTGTICGIAHRTLRLPCNRTVRALCYIRVQRPKTAHAPLYPLGETHDPSSYRHRFLFTYGTKTIRLAEPPPKPPALPVCRGGVLRRNLPKQPPPDVVAAKQDAWKAQSTRMQDNPRSNPPDDMEWANG